MQRSGTGRKMAYSWNFKKKCVYGIENKGEHGKKGEEKWAHADHTAKNFFFFCLKSSGKSLKGFIIGICLRAADRVNIIRFAIKRLFWFLLVKRI